MNTITAIFLGKIWKKTTTILAKNKSSTTTEQTAIQIYFLAI